jgi:type II secretory pathway pseudopilin PulG
MRHRVHRSFTLAGLLILSLALGCKGDSDVETGGPVPAPPPPPAPGTPPPQAVDTGWRLDPGLLGASRTIRETQDVKSAQQQYQTVLDSARGSGDADLERGALLGLARTAACLGDKDDATQKYAELWSDPAAAPGQPDLTLFWDALSSGFSYLGMGNDAKAREAFQRAVQAIDDVPEKQDWFAAAQLFPQWMLARAGDAAAKAEVEKSLASYKGNYKGPQITFLKLEKANLKGCGLERPAADIEAFAQDTGLAQDPFWTSTGPPPPAPVDGR